MLTKEEYDQLWKDWFKQPLKGVTMPCYEDYEKFEHMWEAVVNMFGPGGIRYIIVAEARPGSSHAPFVYDTLQPATPYLKNMYAASYGGLGPSPGTSNSTLDMINDLVRRGVLLMDLFPFALKYETKMRRRMCANGTIRAAWDGHGATPAYPEHISQRINNLNSLSLLHKKWDLAISAPSTTSGCILNNKRFYPAISVLGNLGNHKISFDSQRNSPVIVCTHQNRICCSCERLKIVIKHTALVPSRTLITAAFK